jgi:hypothetical protein
MDTMVSNRGVVSLSISDWKITQFQIFIMPLSGKFITPVRLYKGDEGNYDDVLMKELSWDSDLDGVVPEERKNFYFSSPVMNDAPLDVSIKFLAKLFL